MRYADFESMIAGMAKEVPAEFLDGIEGIEVTRKTIPHPLRRDIFTLGECVPRQVAGEGPALVRSHVLLHHGSFAALARISESFDWKHEAWETLTHELRHHLEWRASVPDLEALDDAAEANYARHDGEPFPPLFFQDGEKLAEGITKVEDDVFHERLMSKGELETAAGSTTSLSWHGREWRLELPSPLGDIHFITLEGLEPEPAGEVVLVIRRRPGARDLWLRATVLKANVECRMSNDE